MPDNVTGCPTCGARKRRSVSDAAPERSMSRRATPFFGRAIPRHGGQGAEGAAAGDPMLDGVTDPTRTLGLLPKQSALAGVQRITTESHAEARRARSRSRATESSRVPHNGRFCYSRAHPSTERRRESAAS